MRKILKLLTLPFLVSNLQATTPETLTSDLLAVEHPVTAGEWLRAHPKDTLQSNAAALDVRSLTGNPFCAVSTGQLKIAEETLNRQIFFRIPDLNVLRLPAGDGPNKDLTAKCVLSEIVVQSTDDVPSLEALLSRIQNDMLSTLGPGQSFYQGPREPYPIWVDFRGRGGTDWHRGGSRWISGIDTFRHQLIAIGLTAAAQRIGASVNDALMRSTSEKMRAARSFAAATKLPPAEIQRMQNLLEVDAVDQWPQTPSPKRRLEIPQAAAFIVNWVKQSRSLSPDRCAAGLYTADVVLTYLPLFISENTSAPLSRKALDAATARIRSQLSGAGAHYEYNALGASYNYEHDWVQEAFKAAPDSLAGQQAFLFLLDQAFNPGCCWSGNGFENVIKRAPQYLREHPQWNIRSQILLAIGDAYRDKIAIANGANGDPFGDAARLAPSGKESYREALRYYRAAVTASPGTDSANQALAEAWALEAGLPPLDTRFVRIYD